MRRVLLLGASGQLGQEVKASLPTAFHLETRNHQQADLTDHASLRKTIEDCKPDIVMNCAAYTAVDLAEQEQEQAFAVNAEAVGAIADAITSETRFIHISTDFVFSKPSAVPYTPSCTPAPVSVYGRSKLAGESRILQSRPNNSVIIRASWLYSACNKNFVLTMLRLMSERDELQVVADQLGSPTSTKSLAKVVWKLAGIDCHSGIYHWSDAGVASWYDFAVEIHRQARQKGLLDHDVVIKPVTTAEYPTPARRPQYSALDSTKTEQATGIIARPWQTELDDVLEIIKDSRH